MSLTAADSFSGKQRESDFYNFLYFYPISATDCVRIKINCQTLGHKHLPRIPRCGPSRSFYLDLQRARQETENCWHTSLLRRTLTHLLSYNFWVVTHRRFPLVLDQRFGAVYSSHLQGPVRTSGTRACVYWFLIFPLDPEDGANIRSRNFGQEPKESEAV